MSTVAVITAPNGTKLRRKVDHTRRLALLTSRGNAPWTVHDFYPDMRLARRAADKLRGTRGCDVRTRIRVTENQAEAWGRWEVA